MTKVNSERLEMPIQPARRVPIAAPAPVLVPDIEVDTLPMAIDDMPPNSNFGSAEGQAQAHSIDFVDPHFGNSERAEVYGVSNDLGFDTDLAQEEKSSTQQVIWIVAALLALTAIGYWAVH